MTNHSARSEHEGVPFLQTCTRWLEGDDYGARVGTQTGKLASDKRNKAEAEKPGKKVTIYPPATRGEAIEAMATALADAQIPDAYLHHLTISDSAAMKLGSRLHHFLAYLAANPQMIPPSPAFKREPWAPNDREAQIGHTLTLLRFFIESLPREDQPAACEDFDRGFTRPGYQSTAGHYRTGEPRYVVGPLEGLAA